uniref:Uncharacterized protein n=1 Tax=Klebsiella pneumoniae TaxID=573 RepID=A0A8B0SS91_KLEPN|nr:hypothetical protein [Klebsiella pneumoniae]
MACRYGTELFISLLPGEMEWHFYGVLHDKEILSLLAGLVKYNHITAKTGRRGCRSNQRQRNKNSSLNATVFGYRYSHANTIRVLLEKLPGRYRI